MRPLSAIDAIAPAWNHSRRLLLTPRNWRLLLKIGAVAFFANMGGGCGNFNYGNPGHMPHLPPAIAASIFAIALIVGGGVLLVSLAFFYLGSRLQFVLFEVVLRRDTQVAPIWRRYGRATWYWIGLKLAFFAAALLCMVPLVIPVILYFVHSFHSGTAESHHIGAFFGAVLGFIFIAFAIVLIVGAAYILLLDFGLPSMALEGTRLAETVRRVVHLVRAEPGQVLLYVFMRFVLALAGAIVFEIALVFGILIALIPLGGIGVALWAGLRHAGILGHVFMIAGWAILGIVLFALLMVAAIMTFGYLYTFLQAYALYFLGGRYAPVGHYLEPLLPQPVYAYPAAAQEEYLPVQTTEAPLSPNEPDPDPDHLA